MRLTKTNGGNWAKQITITGGGKWCFCGNFATREQAEAAAAIQTAKGRKISLTEEATSKSQSKKHGVPIGQRFFRLEAYIERSRPAMTHASKAECLTAGVAPGPMND